MNFKLFISALLLILGHFIVNAQQTTIATGGNANNPSLGSVSYSIGEINYNIISSNNGTITQGVQQPLFMGYRLF